MLCFQCGSPVPQNADKCPNCGANLSRSTRRLEKSSEGLRRMTMELKAIDVKAQIFPPGEVIAERFKITELIGEGPFGQVFKAQDTLIEADVALKIFRKEIVQNPLHQERFLSAARAARTLTQRNVVRLHDSGMHKDHAWVSMQHLEGLSLRKILKMRQSKGEHFTLEELEPIISQITLGLQHVGRDSPHGNLKPENIVFLPELLKITDSYVLSAIAPEIFSSRLKDSTYLAPELHGGDFHPDPRCDVYSVGMILGEMLFGEDYVPGGGDMQGGPQAALDALCGRATAFDPSERYASVEALSEDFATLVDTGRLLERRANAGEPARPPMPPPAPQSGKPSPSGGGPPAPPTAPPAPPMAPPTPPSRAGEANPLLEETPRDIGEPLEEDLATMEVSRTEEKKGIELGDLLETNEVQRGQLPPPPRNRSVTQTMVEPKPEGPAKKNDGPPLLVLGILAGMAILVVTMVVLSSMNKERTVVTLGDASEEIETARTASESAEQEGDEAKASLEVAESEEPSQEVVLAFAQASTQWGTALTSARSTADSAGEALAARLAAEEAEKAQQAAQAQQAETSRTGSAERTGAPARATESARPATPPAGTTCPADMVLVSTRSANHCIDAYEYPGRGSMPRTQVSWFDARRLCAEQGKRLCQLSEWRQACGSAAYPYGSRFDADRCNTADEDGFERSIARAGSFPRCRSRSGAYDMSGNVHEWVEEKRVAGGGYDSDEDLASCRYSSPKAPGSGDANIGFRCCAAAQ